VTAPASIDAAPDAVLKVQGLGKRYRLFASPRDRLASLLGFADRSKAHWALRDVDFELVRGQCLGVIGDNGAGKSTLLKLLAGTLQPSHGQLTRQGRVTAILELGAGFHPDFTGRDNLVFGGSFIGLSQADMLRLSEEIIEFSELGEAIDRPVKTYSSGMVVRLAFALVTAVQPEVLIIDEALAVGDQSFQKKCVQRIETFRRNGCTILFCSHSLYHVRHLCNVALWLDAGQVKAFGETEAVLGSYETHVRARDKALKLGSTAPVEAQTPTTGVELTGTTAESVAAPTASADGAAAIVSVHIADLGEDLGNGEPPVLASRNLVVTVTARVPSNERPNMAVMLEQSHGVGITSVATHADGFAPVRGADKLWRATLTFTDLPLHTGEYVVSAYLFDSQGLVVYEQWYHYLHFKFVNPSLTPGLVRLPHFWT
jgi:lipopolysaccharide transport system ATP-binding protein